MRKRKSAEIQRFLQVLDELKLTPQTIEEQTGISARTINNFVWENRPLGGALLRGMVEQFGVSADWLLTGRGATYLDGRDRRRGCLVPFRECVDLSVFRDVLWLQARCIEEALIESGAMPSEDYSMIDVFKLALPYAQAKVASGEAVLLADSRL